MRHEKFFTSFMHMWCFMHAIIPAAEKVAVAPGPDGGSMGWIRNNVTYTVKGGTQTATTPIVAALTQLRDELAAELDANNPKSLTYFVKDPKGITLRLKAEGEKDSYNVAKDNERE
jgi:hypothetical protein